MTERFTIHTVDLWNRYTGKYRRVWVVSDKKRGWGATPWPSKRDAKAEVRRLRKKHDER